MTALSRRQPLSRRSALKAGLVTAAYAATKVQPADAAEPDLASVARDVAVIKEAPLNIEHPEYGADPLADDNSPALALAVAALPDTPGHRGGEILLPRIYDCASQLNLDNKVSITFRGVGHATSGGNNASGFRFTGAGSAPKISAKSTHGVTIRDMQVCYSNAGFTGDLIDTDWSGAEADPAYVYFENLFLGGTSVSSARSLIRLNRTIFSTIDRCVFANAKWAIRGQDPSYSNAVSIRDCIFYRLVDGAIVDPGESWLVEGSAFEPLQDGRACGIVLGAGKSAWSLTVDTNWWGDISADGNWWIDLSAGNCWGLKVTGNRLSQPGLSAGGSLKLGRGQGAHIAGNRFEGNTAIGFAVAYWLGAHVAGNDFQTTNKILNPENARGLVALANNGLANVIDDYSSLTIASPLTLSSHLQLGNDSEIQWPDATIARAADGVLSMPRMKWRAAAEQTTVGAAGGASAPPATPVRWLKVVDSTGAVLAIPAYAS